MMRRKIVASVGVINLTALAVYWIITATRTTSESWYIKAVSMQQEQLQSDPVLIQHIHDHVLIPPATGLPYQGLPNNTIVFSEKKIEALLAKLFQKKKHGIFVEAGAYDGSTASNTLFLEKYLNWTGLLVEPIPGLVERMIKKHRKAWIAPVCLSETFYPKETNFTELEQVSYDTNSDAAGFSMYRCEGVSGAVMVYNDDDNNPVTPGYHNCTAAPLVAATCYPLYSLLLTLGYTQVDFLSLDIEGNEIPVLRTIPFHKVNIKVILVEVNKLDRRWSMVKFMKTKGYTRLTKYLHFNLLERLPNDMLFIKEKNKPSMSS